MEDIASKAIVLKLNGNWEPVDVALVCDTICDLIMGVVLAIDIVYKINPDGSPDMREKEYVNPVDWDEWIKLPIMPWHQTISSAKMKIRVPTVVIAHRFKKMPMKRFKGKPTKESLMIRDDGRDYITGKKLSWDEATIDHEIPLSRGGKDVHENTGLTTREINNQKGNQLNEEIGVVPVIKPTKIKEIPYSHTIRRMKHPDWRTFMKVTPISE